MAANRLPGTGPAIEGTVAHSQTNVGGHPALPGGYAAWGQALCPTAKAPHFIPGHRPPLVAPPQKSSQRLGSMPAWPPLLQGQKDAYLQARASVTGLLSQGIF